MTNIIKDKISLSDFINYENNDELHTKETIVNNKLIQKKNDQELFNLSINEITNNFSKEFINILNDIVYLFHTGSNNLMKDLIIILTKEERLIYVGMFCILLSFFFYFMDISN
jgi:hypothetical protein